MNNLQQEFKQYLIENYRLDKKEWLINKAFNDYGSDIRFRKNFTVCANKAECYTSDLVHDLDNGVYLAVEQDIPYEKDYFFDKLCATEIEKIIREHIKIFDLDEYVKQHIERMV